jgi:hypothetical protein
MPKKILGMKGDEVAGGWKRLLSETLVAPGIETGALRNSGSARN